MSDAMILPCGHTFGAGGIEQVKQMVQSFIMSFFRHSLLFCSMLFSFAYGVYFFVVFSLRKLAALVLSQYQKTR